MSSLPFTLVPTKFHPPAADARQVRRESILQSIVQSSARLVLVRAPAGFGKTTVMAQVRQQLEDGGCATAWMTVDAADNDPARFLASLGAALDDLLASAPPPGRPAGREALGEMALGLMDRVASIGFPAVVFLDEFEAVHAPGVLALVAQLLERLPAGARLVIGSRNVPDLRLARLRASGQMLEIGPRQLRFSLHETTTFFGSRAGKGMRPDEIELLQRKTEGWVAALWLAWVALEHHQRRTEFISAFSGTDASLAEYLAEEVLAQQPEPVRKLLLSTSILREISAPVCRELVPEVDSGAMLQQLSSANVFLLPVEAREGHWRYHSLFSSFLRGQLQKEMPAAVPRLHLTAARWFLAHGRPVPAVDHFIAAGEPTEAVRVLRDEAMPLLMQGRLRLLSRWFDALAANALQEEPLLQVAHAWATCFTKGPEAALSLMRNAGLESSKDREIEAHVAALRATLLSLLDRWEESHVVGTRSLHLIPSPSVFANAALVNNTAATATMRGLFPEARQLLARARQAQGDEASAFHRMYSETVEGMIDALQGRLRQARARFGLAVQTTQFSTLDFAHGNAWAGLLYAGSVYETEDPQLAKRLLQVYLPLARDAWLPDHIILGYRLLSRIAYSEGEVDHAFQGLSELEYLGHERRLPRLAAAARLERARLLVLQGHCEAAADELRQAGTPELWRLVGTRRHLAHEEEDLEVGNLRWQALAGEPRAASAALDAAATQANRHGRTRREHKLRLLQAIALSRAGEANRALDVFLPVLKSACEENAMRFVLDEGRAAAALVVQVQARLEHPHADPLFAEYLQRLRAGFGHLAADEAASAAPPAALPPHLEALTPKEIRLLQLLAEGYSNRALTEKLFVSDSTVRTHLRNINGKLGANNRTQAVAMGRRLGLIR